LVPEPVIAEADTIHIELPASLKYLGVLSACVTEILARVEHVADRPRLVASVQLAVQEIGANVVKHAYAGRADGRIAGAFTLTAEPRSLVVELYDTGRSFDPAAVPAPDLAAVAEGGYGLFLVRNLMDEAHYQAEARGNRWRLVKRLDVASAAPPAAPGA
jgi:anti-sigma regulatory factor (Ser/Thr protein kinase)